MNRRATLIGGLLVALSVATMVAAAPVGPAGGARDCERPPVTMRLTGGGPLAGGADVELRDGLARRVPILVGRDEPARTQRQLERLQERAAKTGLALYQIFLADFRIPRKRVVGEFSSAFPVVEPKADKVFVSIAAVPTRARGLKAGDVLSFDDELSYDTTTTFAPIGLNVVTSAGEAQSGTADGQVEVRSVDDDEICIDIDFEISDEGEVVAAADGVVAVPVVRAPKRLFFF